MVGAILLVAQTQATLVLADRTELRARDTSAETGPPHLDAVTTPSLRLRWAERGRDLLVTYNPTLTAADLGVSLSPELLHAASVDAGIRLSRRARISVNEALTYGDRNFSYLVAPPAPAPGDTTPAPTPIPTPPPQLVASSRTLRFGSTRTALSVQVVPARRWSFTSSVSYLLSGGLDAESRETVPVQRGPRADVSAGYQITRRDGVGAALSATSLSSTGTRCTIGTDTGATCRPEVQIAEGSLSYRHALSRQTSFTMTGGASLTRTRIRSEVDADETVFGTGGTALTHAFAAFGERMALGADLRLTVVVDSRTSLADQRAIGTTTLAWTHGRFTTRLGATATRSVDLDGPTAATALGGTAEVTYRASRFFGVLSGVNLAWQDQRGLGSLFSRVAYVAVTAETAPWRF